MPAQFDNMVHIELGAVAVAVTVAVVSVETWEELRCLETRTSKELGLVSLLQCDLDSKGLTHKARLSRMMVVGVNLLAQSLQEVMPLKLRRFHSNLLLFHQWR